MASATVFTAHPARTRRSRVRYRVVTVATVLALLLAAGVTVDLARYASATDGRLLAGTIIRGHDVGGFLPDEAHATIAAELDAELARTVTVRFEDRAWTRSLAELGVTSDLDDVIAEAARAAEVGLLDRARTRYLGRVDAPRLDVTVTSPAAAIDVWLEEIVGEIDREAIEASVDLDGSRLEVRPHQVGLTVDVIEAAARVAEGLASGDADVQVRLPVTRTVPERTTADLGQILFLDQSDHRLDLYLDGRLAHSYTVTTGTGRYPTPVGEFEITKKRPNPTWVNPAPDGWGRGMPRSIGPGPNNPLGVRALNWSIGAIRFHGTARTWELGHDASKGCVRLSNGDIVHLYDLVDVGATIISVR